MDYKQIIKSRRLRLRILNLLSWIPDSVMIRIQYRIKTGNRLNLHNPKRFTEKIQWYKLNYKNPELVRCVDKYEVRAFLNEKGFSSILTKCYGIYSRIEDIDFDKLPNQFVVKNTLGLGGTSVIICKDKKNFNLEDCKEKLKLWLNEQLIRGGGREWPYYSGKKARIIIEEYLEDNNPRGLIDYKFMCFNGQVRYVHILCDRVLGVSVKEGIFSKDFRLLKVSEDDHEIPRCLTKPKNYKEMLKIAESLSKEFPHVRVDLYNINGRIVFGELTFYDGSGYAKYSPDDFDYKMGSYFKI